ncbi:putative transcriptional regulator [Litorimonas taeanensis]|uniref:Putative transcriptional regulator n=1 Tax=Litorimonas taeanensis TaxID=568099 RepID=A0A420WJQ3_9PROT|nr:helix-turn-helix transcriptional regulator [Litorimonas taeanensis]RKQ71253.1 putative transcriptional regulator [Litorimonas taeanensis]
MGGKKTKITNHVKRTRLLEGLSQVELAKRVGATRQTIIAVEAERYAPSLELAFRIAHVLGEPIESLFVFDSTDWT